MLKIISAPKEAKTSDLYSVYVRQGGDWQELSIYLALAPNGISNWIKLSDEAFQEFDGLDHGTVMVKTYISNFSFDGVVDIKIKYNGDVQNFNIKPRNSVNFRQNSNEVEFTLDKPCKLIIEPDGDEFGSLHLFAEAPEIFDKTSYDNVIYFEKGFHTAENNDNIIYNEHGVPVIQGITDNTLIFAEQGAVVCAVVEMVSVSHVKLAGHGIYSLLDRCFGAESNFELPTLYGGFRENSLPSIYVHADCDDIILQDATLICEFRGVCARNSTNITVDNIKSFSAAVNGDGINYINVVGSEIKNSYFQSSDDCIAIFTSVDSILTLWDAPEHTKEARSADITIHDCLFWTNARIFMIGGHATCNKELHDPVENIKIYDCEVATIASNINGETYEHRLYWSGIFRVLSQSEGLVRNIFFENITVNWTKGYNGKPFHVEVRGNGASYSESSGYRIENVSFKDIRFFDVPDDYLPTYIKSVEYQNTEYCVDGVTFENITFDGDTLAAESLIIQGNTQNITVINP